MFDIDAGLDEWGDVVSWAWFDAPPLEQPPLEALLAELRPESDWQPGGWLGVCLAEDLLAEDWASDAQRAQARADLVTAYAGLPPSAAGVAALSRVDPSALPGFALADYLVLVDRCRSWVESLAVRGLAALDRSDATEERWSREQVMCSWRVSARAAERQLATAKTLARELPGTMAALAAGGINAEQARAVAAGSWRLDSDAVTTPVASADAGGSVAARPAEARLEAAVLPRAAGQTAGATRASMERAVLTIDPAAARQRHERAYADRDVATRALPDGMASVTAWLRAVDAERLMTGLNAAARARPRSDPRSRGQRRADLLLDAVLAATDEDALAVDRDAAFDTEAGPAPAASAVVGVDSSTRTRGGRLRGTRKRSRAGRAHGRRVQVHLHVSLATLLGVDEAPGWVDGQGPITAAEARRVAHQLGGSWARVVDDPLGRPLAYGRQVYEPPQALADHVLARDGECSFPSCRQPAWTDDLDHITAWDDGGTTDPDNLASLCRRHHRGKTQRALHYTRHDDGSYTWTLAAINGGNPRTHLSQPPRRLDPAPWEPEPHPDWTAYAAAHNVPDPADFPDEPPF